LAHAQPTIHVEQANPGQEFIVLKVRATNTDREQHWTPRLRLRTDSGVLLEPSARVRDFPLYLPARAEQDSLFAWQVPRGPQNPSLMIASDAGEVPLPIGPLPPPPA
jgi:hypothetical protein